MPVMMLPAAPGKCQFCAGTHSPTDPHNKDSLFYQMRFNGLYGRWPTWADAIAHCSTMTQLQWRAELERRGAWTEAPDGVAICEKPPIQAAVETCASRAPIPMPHLEPQVVQFQRKKRKPKEPIMKWKCRICGAQFAEKKAHGCLNGTNPKNWIKIKNKAKKKG